jgi:hypothetical protein
MSLKGSTDYREESELVNQLRRQLEDLKKARTGIDTPEERLLEDSIDKTQRRLNEAEWAENAKRREAQQEEQFKKRGTSKAEWDKKQEELRQKGIQEAIHPKISEGKPKEMQIIEGYASKMKPIPPPECKGTLKFKRIITYESDSGSREPLRLYYKKDEVGILGVQTLKQNFVSGWVKTDEFGEPKQVWMAGIPLEFSWYYNVELTGDLPEKMLARLYDAELLKMQKVTEEVKAKIVELGKVNIEQEAENQSLKATILVQQTKIDELELEKSKRILNRLKQMIS